MKEINDILKFAGKWMELGKKNPEWGNIEPERKTSVCSQSKVDIRCKEKDN